MKVGVGVVDVGRRGVEVRVNEGWEGVGRVSSAKWIGYIHWIGTSMRCAVIETILRSLQMAAPRSATWSFQT